MRRLTPFVLAGALVACGPAIETTEESRPAAVRAELDPSTMLALSALPLACLDRPHEAPRSNGYLYEREATPRAAYTETRAFYGCYDWHSAVNSTWALVELLSRHPGSRIAPLIVEKLDQHLGPTQLAGEVEFFRQAGGFERPYGWAWLLALHAAVVRSEHPKAQLWADSLTPLSTLFVDGMTGYLSNLDYPMRVGTHANTAFAIDLSLDYARTLGNAPFEQFLVQRARDLYRGDRACALRFEPSASDFLSPCLEEAKLMAAVLPTDEFAGWLSTFLADPANDDFRTIAQPIALGGNATDLDTGQLGAKSHLIGLAFTRAEALSTISNALPSIDPRVGAYREIAARQAALGMDAMFDADYLGSHWIGTFAVKYLLTLGERGAVPLG